MLYQKKRSDNLTFVRQAIVGINNTAWVKSMENPVPLLMDKNKTKKIYSGNKSRA